MLKKNLKPLVTLEIHLVHLVILNNHNLEILKRSELHKRTVQHSAKEIERIFLKKRIKEKIYSGNLNTN